jgi:hypothetical protein
LDYESIDFGLLQIAAVVGGCSAFPGDCNPGSTDSPVSEFPADYFRVDLCSTFLVCYSRVYHGA